MCSDPFSQNNKKHFHVLRGLTLGQMYGPPPPGRVPSDHRTGLVIPILQMGKLRHGWGDTWPRLTEAFTP